jgi:hypothetical protein
MLISVIIRKESNEKNVFYPCIIHPPLVCLSVLNERGGRGENVDRIEGVQKLHTKLCLYLHQYWSFKIIKKIHSNYFKK